MTNEKIGNGLEINDEGYYRFWAAFPAFTLRVEPRVSPRFVASRINRGRKVKVLDAGHRYALDNLETGGETVIQFYKDPTLHNGDGYPGPSCQEYIRAIIDRVQELDRERPWEGNAAIIYDLRHAIAGFEARAILRRVEKDGLAIEAVPLANDGHVLFASVGRNAKRQDGETRLGPKGEHAVANGETPNSPPSDLSTDKDG